MAQDKSATDTNAAYAPFTEVLNITTSDVTVYDPPLRGLIVNVAGDVVIETEKGDAEATIAAVQGQVIPALITKVKAASTATVVGGR